MSMGIITKIALRNFGGKRFISNVFIIIIIIISKTVFMYNFSCWEANHQRVSDKKPE